MKGRPTEQLVYEYMYPRPKPSDPQNFHALLARQLIIEVRQEVQAFYGEVQTQEHKYPGLDYCHPTHRLRLSRYTYHRRMFRAFDGLRLTPAEIAGLTKWEGTKWAKERFEREHGLIVRDTATDGIPTWDQLQARPARTANSAAAAGPDDNSPAAVSRRVPAELELNAEVDDDDQDDEEDDDDDDDDAMDGDESDGELQSVGVELNERLLARVAAHRAGDTSQPLDEAWEQWLKQALESGEYARVTDQIALMADADNPLVPADLFPPRMLDAARAGHWHEIPPFLQDTLRRSLGLERSQEQASSAWRRAHPGRRLPVGDALRAAQAAALGEL